ncbi:MAG: MetQ/NlpA family ABC transporter substrate-binding protein [Treponema sp.]|jgi:D-methionine transport system substrate-binding protein|nr:MetQ/NlpA family ABC transporter substrate-binding protein [Treponema sp.]
MKKVFILAGVLVLTAALALPVFAGPKKDSAGGAQVLKVGATPVPHAELLNLVKSDLAAQGIDLQVVEFTDYVTPNLSLDAGDLDANFFQHVPYLESFSAERKLDLVSVFGVHVEPLGLYSRSLKNISELQNGASVAIPDDPTNRGRALLLLQANGIITLAPSAGIEGTLADIRSNPKNLRFHELEAPQLPRALGDVDAAVINGNYALDAGLNPVSDSLILEGAQSPYVNIVVVKRGNEQDPRILALAAALRSQKVKDYILANYNGGVVPAF